ncbi:MAG: PAS domain-containing sensor histidine kinase [Candidatus Binatia bacterium]|nr:PAS domain-containing sensor histidine kinase [Candidatus Binatia bacterium]
MKRMVEGAACRRSEVRYRDLCENTDTLIQHATPDGRLLYVNPAWQQALGYADDEIEGLSLFQVLHPQCPPAHRDLFRQVLRGERTRARIETLFRTRAGEALAVAGTLTCRWAKGRPVGMLGFFQDISAKRGWSQDGKDSLAMFLHDLKNPVTAILGYTQLLCELAEEQGLRQICDMLYRIETNARSLCALVGNYVDGALREAEPPGLRHRPLVLNELLCRIALQYEIEARQRGLSLQVQLQNNLPLICGDAVELERVFTNLLHNALKFTPPGGRILVCSEQQDQAVVVHIRDTGPGVPPDELPFLFDKYWQGKVHRRDSGAGLGLFIVKTLVDAHGGRVAVTNHPEGGACFSVFLPLSATAPQWVTPSAVSEGGGSFVGIESAA